MTTASALQFLRFLIVGTANTALSYGLYAGFLWLGLPYPVANLLSFLISLVIGFQLQGRMVFRNAQQRRFGRYVLAWCTIFLVNLGLITVFVQMGLSAYLAGALALVPVVITSYLVQRLWVFRPSAGEGEGGQAHGPSRGPAAGDEPIRPRGVTG